MTGVALVIGTFEMTGVVVGVVVWAAVDVDAVSPPPPPQATVSNRQLATTPAGILSAAIAVRLASHGGSGCGFKVGLGGVVIAPM